jgi:hypothetical protein
MLTLALAIIAAGLLAMLVFLIRRRRAGGLETRLAAVSRDVISNVLIPDGEGGEIHLDYVLLLPDRILLLDIRQLTGNVFGSDTMQDWTVINGSRRFTFANPQHALYDRLAALRRLLPGAQISGVIAFGSGAIIKKGMPTDVTELESLLTKLQRLAGPANAASPALDDAWVRLRQEAVVAQVARLMQA